MGEALIYALEETLGGDLTDSVKDAWRETYKALSEDMIRAQVKSKA